MQVKPHRAIDRARIAVLRFLTFHNRLEGHMAFVGVWWGFMTLMFPDFWTMWPTTQAVTLRAFGHPEILSWTLLVTGVVGYSSWHSEIHWRRLRKFCAFAAFVCWTFLAIVFGTLDPPFTIGVATYSLFAFATIIVALYLELDIEGAVEQINLEQAKLRAEDAAGGP